MASATRAHLDFPIGHFFIIIIIIIIITIIIILSFSLSLSLFRDCNTKDTMKRKKWETESGKQVDRDSTFE